MTRNRSETRIVVGTEDGYIVLYEIQIDGILFDKSFNKQDCNLKNNKTCPYSYEIYTKSN